MVHDDERDLAWDRLWSFFSTPTLSNPYRIKQFSHTKGTIGVSNPIGPRKPLKGQLMKTGVTGIYTDRFPLVELIF